MKAIHKLDLMMLSILALLFALIFGTMVMHGCKKTAEPVEEPVEEPAAVEADDDSAGDDDCAKAEAVKP